MNFKNFLLAKESDFKGRMIQDIWNYSDEEIENNHDFIQIIFPLNKKSQSVFHGYYLETDDLVQSLKDDEQVKENILKSSEWFLSFLKRHDYWKRGYNHNQLRITRVIECLRLVVGQEEANSFYYSIISISNSFNLDKSTVKHWRNAIGLS
ncbi:opioid growth factor receptor-related protein [Gammaproteobacteria bacterium]|nr:opioid growth factor receptor-related protein [Gammaproteobacteria bacterium]